MPQAVAYASLAGLPVETGLYVATVPMLAYALVGTSRPLSVSSTSLLLLNRQSRPGTSVLGRVPSGDVYVALEHEPAARAEPGLLVLRLDAPMLFINAKLLRDRVREQLPAAETPVRIVLLDLQFTPALDIESLDEARIYRSLADAVPDARAALRS